jgi:hypothetical protein
MFLGLRNRADKKFEQQDRPSESSREFISPHDYKKIRVTGLHFVGFTAKLYT